MNNKSDVKRLIILIGIGVLSYLLLSNFDFVYKIVRRLFIAISPFIIGIVLAFILNILMTKIEKLLIKMQEKFNMKFKTRGLSITFSLIIFVLALVFISLQLVPELIENLENLIKSIPTIFINIEDYIMNLVKDYPEIQVQISELFKNSTNWNALLVNVINYIINGSINFVTSFVSSLITVFTAIVFAIYMLSQKEVLISGAKKVLKVYIKEDKYKKLMEIGKLSNETFTKFISGQCLEALILGSIFFLVLTIFRFPYVLLISIISCITALIPIFGAYIAIVIGAILIATVSPIQALIFVIIFIIIQQIEGNLIYPRVVGKSVGLSPIWTLLAITVCGSLFGVIGMLVGLPLASIIYALIKKDILLRTKKIKIN